MTTILYILVAILIIIFVIPFLLGVFGAARLLPSEGYRLFKQIDKRLKEEASLYKFKNDIEKLQETNAQILWLKVIDEVNSRDILGNKKNERKQTYLDNITESDLQYPNKFDFFNFNHYPFAQEVISGYRKVLADNEYAFYKPNSILPYPQKLILKSILFVIDFIEQNEPIYQIDNKAEQLENLSFIKSALYLNFIHDPKGILPKQGMENFRCGKELLVSRPNDDIIEKELMDWK